MQCKYSVLYFGASGATWSEVVEAVDVDAVTRKARQMPTHPYGFKFIPWGREEWEQSYCITGVSPMFFLRGVVVSYPDSLHLPHVELFRALYGDGTEIVQVRDENTGHTTTEPIHEGDKMYEGYEDGHVLWFTFGKVRGGSAIC